MTKLIAALAAVAAVLALPGVAAGKELTKVEVCGASSCTTITDRETLRELPTGGETTSPPPPAAGYYTVRLTVDAGGEQHDWRVFYVPSADMLAAPAESGAITWFPVYGPAARAMASLVEGLEAFAPPDIARARVGSKPVDDPDSYLRLFEVTSAGDALPQKADWTPIELRSSVPSPWTSGPTALYYSPSARALQRGSEVLLLSRDLAADIARGASLAPGDATFPRLMAAVALAGALLLAAVVAHAFRRRRPAGRARRPSVA